MSEDDLLALATSVMQARHVLCEAATFCFGDSYESYPEYIKNTNLFLKNRAAALESEARSVAAEKAEYLAMVDELAFEIVNIGQNMGASHIAEQLINSGWRKADPGE